MIRLSICSAAIAALALVSPAPHAAPFLVPNDGGRLALDYDGVLLVKVLDMRIEQRVSQDAFAADAKIKSYGVLAMFKKVDVRAVAQGAVRGDDLRPASFHHENLDGQANRKVQVRWTGEDVTTAALPAYPSMGDPAPTRAQKLAAADPLTQLMRLSLASAGDSPCNGATRMFDGRQLYEVTLSAPRVRPQTTAEQKFGLSHPVTCTLVFSEVAGFDAKPKQNRTQGLKMPLTVAFAQVGADGPWVISSLRGATPLGEAKIELRAVRGLPDPV